jgi:hypothetical protein
MSNVGWAALLERPPEEVIAVCKLIRKAFTKSGSISGPMWTPLALDLINKLDLDDIVTDEDSAIAQRILKSDESTKDASNIGLTQGMSADDAYIQGFKDGEANPSSKDGRVAFALGLLTGALNLVLANPHSKKMQQRAHDALDMANKIIGEEYYGQKPSSPSEND